MSMVERAAGWPAAVQVVEVGPRDGLQSLERVYPIETRAEMIRELVDAGADVMEATSFMRPDIVPQMQDAEALLALLREQGVEGTFKALVPNVKGAERAVSAGVDELVALFTVSEAYCRKNQNMTPEQNVEAVRGIARVAEREGLPLRVALGLTMFCPYEGDLAPQRTYDYIAPMYELGIREFTVASSVGVDGPGRVYALCAGIMERWPDVALGYHLHNTNGLGSANVLAALEAGVSSIETSIGGLGGGIRMPRGMPYFGNFPTEDLVQMLDEMGVDTGIELGDILHAGERILALLELDEPASYAGRGGTRGQVRELGAGNPA
jgi:hydroxymethylglutaryl-CoA lyase